MPYNLYPLKVPKSSPLFKMWSIWIHTQQTVSALCPVIQYTRTSNYHSPKSWCISRRERTKIIIKSRKVFSTCALMNTKLFQNRGERGSAQFNWQDLSFFLMIDSLCDQEQPKLLVKVPNKILNLHAISSEKESNAVFGFQELGHPFMRHRFVTSLFPWAHACQSAVKPKLQRQYIMPAESSHVSEIGSYFCTVFR